ncbi:MAG: glycosyltransferase family 4 protein [Chloroflexi bacterium]|nr:glycosyltransferase family 4 protein [Chloroflexota bacterium]
MKTLRIGVLRRRWHHYSYTRNVLHRLPEAQYVPVNDVFSWAVNTTLRINRVARRTIGRPLWSHFNLNNQFWDFDRSGVDVIHLFNGISYGHTPWVSTFETAVPRFLEVMAALHSGEPDFNRFQRWRFEKAIQAAASDHCLGLVALSERARRAQHLVLAWSNAPDLAQTIAAKTRVLHPPQPLLVEDFTAKTALPLKPLRFMFVGHDFFRKGGLEMLRTFVDMRKESPWPFTLTIVSALQGHDYATQAGEAEIAEAQRLIHENQDWIQHFPRLPYEDVLARMQQAHVGMLPTYADSYGYSVLEFQAAGCPVITTNINALAEINAAERGWVIEVPRTSLGEATFHTPEGRQAVSAAIAQGIRQALEEILANPEIVLQKGQAAYTYVQQHHDPAQHAQALREIYNSA